MAGGASIYSQTLPYADRMYISYIKGDYEGDAFFPEFDPSDWQTLESIDRERFRFVIYRR